MKDSQSTFLSRFVLWKLYKLYKMSGNEFDFIPKCSKSNITLVHWANELPYSVKMENLGDFFIS